MQIYAHFYELILIFFFVERRFTEFGGTIPMRPVQDLAFAVARFTQKGGSFVNYYMVNELPQQKENATFILNMLYMILIDVTISSLSCLNYSFFSQFHGGTNFGRTAGGPFITTSYDYDAPIDEYGEINQFSPHFSAELKLIMTRKSFCA